MAENYQTAKQVLIKVADEAYAKVFNDKFNAAKGNVDMTVKELREEAMEAALDAVFAEPELIDAVQGGW